MEAAGAVVSRSRGRLANHVEHPGDRTVPLTISSCHSERHIQEAMARAVSLATLFPPFSRILRDNGVQAGSENLANEQATHCMDESDSSDRIGDDVSNHGRTSRPARFQIGAECPYPAMSGHRI